MGWIKENIDVTYTFMPELITIRIHLDLGDNPSLTSHVRRAIRNFFSLL